MTQIVKLGSPHAATADDSDLRDDRAVQRENALDSNAVRDLADGKGRANATAPLGNANPFECLESFLVAFTHAHADAKRITGPERWDVVTEPLFLGFDEGVHM